MESGSLYSYLETMNFSVICMDFQEPKVTEVIINRNMFMCTVLDTHRHTYLHLPTPHTDTLIYTHTHTHTFKGRHPCLWCTIPSDELKKPQYERGKYPARTLESLQADHLRFESIGKGDIRQAKYYNNVIGSAFFNVPLTQVCT